jgi:Glycosyl hydrolases family 39
VEAECHPVARPRQRRALIHALVTHLALRYGLEEVPTWLYRILERAEPVTLLKGHRQAAYVTLCQEMVAVIKEVFGRFRVDGPAAFGGTHYGPMDLPRFCDRASAQVTFLSRYTYSKGSRLPRAFAARRRKAPTEALARHVASGWRCADGSAFPDLAAHITERNSSCRWVSPLTDMAFNAAYLTTARWRSMCVPHPISEQSRGHLGLDDARVARCSP